MHVRLEAARRYMIAHIDRRASLRTLATIAGLSPFHFHRLFRARYGMPPRAYYERLRVGHARRLIELGRPLSRAAHESGFCDQSHLSRVFKRMIGVPPGAFAARLRDRDAPANPCGVAPPPVPSSRIAGAPARRSPLHSVSEARLS